MIKHRELGFLLAGGIVAVVLSGTAIAITDTNFTYSTQKSGFYMVGPADLQPEQSDSQYSSVLLDLRLIDEDDFACFNTALHLPQDARIVSVTSYYTSAKTDLHTRVSLYRVDPTSDESERMFFHPIFDNSGSRSSVTDSIPRSYNLVRNNKYSYIYGVCLTRHPPTHASDIFYGARITYRYSTAGD